MTLAKQARGWHAERRDLFSVHAPHWRGTWRLSARHERLIRRRAAHRGPYVLLRPSPAPWLITLNAPSSATEPHARPPSELLALLRKAVGGAPTPPGRRPCEGRGAGAATGTRPRVSPGAGHRILCGVPRRPSSGSSHFCDASRSAPRWTRFLYPAYFPIPVKRSYAPPGAVCVSPRLFPKSLPRWMRRSRSRTTVATRTRSHWCASSRQ